MPHNACMSIFHSEDRGIESEEQGATPMDADNDGVVEDGLGNPAAAEEDTGD
jgi:hypothetical protein